MGKKKGKKKSEQSLGQLQQQLNQQIEEMKNGSGKSGRRMSEDLAKMAAARADKKSSSGHARENLNRRAASRLVMIFWQDGANRNGSGEQADHRANDTSAEGNLNALTGVGEVNA